MAFTINVNGRSHTVDVDGDTPLLWVLRDVLGMTGTKFGCGMALCGACTVHSTARHPLLRHPDRQRRQLRDHDHRGDRRDNGGRRSRRPGSTEKSQCGYCQSGQIMSAAALLREPPSDRCRYR